MDNSKIYKVGKGCVAILLATYNGYNFLEEQIQSILKQNNSEWQLFIHDDGSTDGSREIIAEYCSQYPDRIHEILGETTGCARNNFFYMLEQVEADYYMFCDQDDVWMPYKVETLYKRMRRLELNNTGNTIPLLVFSDLMVVGNNLELIAESLADYQSLDCKNVSFARLLAQNVITGCSMIINRDLRNRMILPCNRNRIIMHDWWAGLIAARFGTVRFVNRALVMYRQHDTNSVGAINTKSLKYYIDNLNKVKNNKNSLRLTRIQAKEFSNTFEEEEESLSYRYAYINKSSWAGRQLFYHKNGIKKSGTGRKIGMFLWG